MKHVTATEARKNWFSLLDAALSGEVIAIRRNDENLILQLQPQKRSSSNYKELIDFPDADKADTWSWEWRGPGKMAPKKPARSKR